MSSRTLKSIKFQVFAIVVIGVLGMGMSLAAYWLQFGSARSSSQQDWGNFGNYVNGLPTLILAAANLALLGYIVTVLADAENRQKQTRRQVRALFELEREWNTFERTTATARRRFCDAILAGMWCGSVRICTRTAHRCGGF